MRIKLNSVIVDDQDKALDFYTRVLGFLPGFDIPVGEFRWITVRSPDGGDAEVTLEPNANPAARTYQNALFEQGIPLTAFEVDDVGAESERLGKLGVQFTMPPTEAGQLMLAVLSDTCGNLIQIYQPPSVG
jgi:glyoxylase I family protein